MKVSRKAIGMVGLIAVASFMFATSSMAATCTNAKVTLVGPNAAFPNNTAMQITCVSGKSTDWGAPLNGSIPQSIHPDLTDQVLATALTAVSLGKNVYVFSTTGLANGMITGMYLQNN